VKTHVWIASTSWDYEKSDGEQTRPVRNDDTKLPIDAVWFRVISGRNYLGDEEVKRLRDIYEAQGIAFYGVVVPLALVDYALQRRQALSALRLCRGLEFDVEPYSGYLGSETGIQAWLENVLVPVRHTIDSSPNPIDHGKDISLCYDPREQWLDGWDFAKAIQLSDSLAPMVYTGMYSGQDHWGEPIDAIRAARAQCPSDKVFRPILQTYSIDPSDTMTAFNEAVRINGHPILFRRGVTPVEIWNAIEAIGGLVPVEEEDELSSREYQELSGRIDSITLTPGPPGPQGPQGPPGRDLTAAPPGPTTPKVYTVVHGDTLSGIAVKHGVDAGRWTEIPNIPANVRADPRELQAGTRLIIPW